MTADRTLTRTTWIAVALAAAAALIVYLPALGSAFGFVNYDDPYLVSAENPAIGKGLAAGMRDLIDPLHEPRFMDAWLPLYYGSLGIDHALFGEAAWGWHLHSALLHALGAALVVILARRIGIDARIAAIAGLLFAVHPAATESVAWVASRKDVLSFVWMALAALCYAEGVARRKPALHALGAACLVVSMLAKASTVVLPLLLGLHALFLRKDDEPARTRLRAVGPYALAAGAMAAAHFLIAVDEGTAGGGSGASVGTVLLANLQVAWRYAVALFVPVVQSVEHGVDASAIDTRQAVLGGALLGAWALALVVTWRQSRAAFAALLAVPLALAPFNNVFPRTSVLFAERYAYVALLPVALALAWVLRPRSDGAAAWVPASLAVAALGLIAILRVPVWRDSVTLWEDAARKAPRSALVQLQLADAYGAAARSSAAGDTRRWHVKAEAAWRSASLLATSELDRLRAETGLATHLLVTAGDAADPAARLRDAVTLLDSAERRLPEAKAAAGAEQQLALVLSNRATVRELLGETDAALADWRRVVATDARSATGWNAIARLELAAGRGDAVLEALTKSEAAAPDDPAAVLDRTRVRVLAGEVEAAKRDLTRASAKHPQNADLLVEAARLDALLLRPLDAEGKLRRALELRPGDASIRETLAAVLLEQAQAQASRDDIPAAREAARRAAEAAPDSSAPEQILGIVARRAGDLDAAIQHFSRARELHREGARIRESLASVLVERAAQLFDEGREGRAYLLVEEAVATGAEVVSTPRARVEEGVAGWPAPDAQLDDRAAVARRAALKGLALLAAARPADALLELEVAEAGTAGGDPRMRRVVLRLLARARFLVGRPDDAVAAAEELPRLAEASDPATTWEGFSQLASALVERGIARRGTGDGPGAEGDLTRAREVLAVARARGMPEARHHLRLGEVLFAEERFLEATKEFDRAAALAPTDADAYLDRAAVWRTLFLIEEDEAYLRGAEADLRRAVAAARNDARVLAALGEVLVMQRKPSEAFPWLQKAVLTDPSLVTARKLLAELAIRAGRTHLDKRGDKKALAEAHSVADRAVALDPPGPEAWIFRGDVWRAEGDWARALAEYESARTRFPASQECVDALAKYYLDLGHAYLLQARNEQAVEAFLRALGHEGTTVDLTSAKQRLAGLADALMREAFALHEKGERDAALERVGLAVRADPTADRRQTQGALLAELGRFDEAAESFRLAFEADPKRNDLRLGRAASLLRVGRLEDAEVEYRAWLATASADDPDRSKAERQLEWIAAEKRALDGDEPR